MTDYSYESLLNACIEECQGFVDDMVGMGVSKSDAIVQAVNIVLDDPFYAGSEIDLAFRDDVLAKLKVLNANGK